MLTKHFGPLARLAVRQELRRQGNGFWKINELMSSWDDDLIDVAIAQTGALIPPELVEVDGDKSAVAGSFIQMIVDFIKSPTGQAIIQALARILLTSLIAL